MQIGEAVSWLIYVTDEKINSRVTHSIEFPVYCGDTKTVTRREYKIGVIANDFLCLFKSNDIDSKNWALDRDRVLNWLRNYYYPPLTAIFPIRGQFPIINPRKDNFDEYCQTLKNRWNAVVNITRNILELHNYPGIILHFDIEHSWDKNLHRTRYVFVNDIYSLILFDIFKATDKYLLQTCPICGSMFFPIDGRKRCTGCEKPVSRLSNSELSKSKIGLDNNHLSNSQGRKALLRKLQRQGKTHDEINMVFRPLGYKPVRNYRKGDRANGQHNTPAE